MCGQIEHRAYTGYGLTMAGLRLFEAIEGKTITGGVLAPQAPVLVTSHKCGDKRVGVSDLIGFYVTEE